MAVFVEVYGTFGLTFSESKTETMCMLIPRATATKIVFNATGQQYRQTTFFTYLGGAMTETPNLSDDRPADPRGMDELQALRGGAVRPPEGKSTSPEGPDGEIHTDARHGPPEGPLHQQHTKGCFFES